MSDFDRDDLDAFESGAPPVPAFSGPDRPHNPKWLKGSAVIIAVASAAVIAFAMLGGPKAPEVSGSVRATARETVTLGTRGVAVAEPGAAFGWKVVGAGNATVDQTAGSVFYRVERGGPFVVSTPAGDVTVTGTCFTVEIRQPSGQTLTGAAISATVLVTVHEGRVLFANDNGNTEIAAGQTAVAGSDRSPQLVAGGPTEIGASEGVDVQ